MIIDFHAHCFPDAIAPKALAPMQNLTGITPCYDGTASGLSAKMKADGIDFAVVCNIATNAHQLAKVNSFAIDVNDFSNTLIALGSAHPDSEILEDELQRLIDHDIRGIKIHPEYMPYYIDDPEWDRVFSLCEEMGIFVLSHTGFDYVSPDKTASTPDRVAKVLDRHPNLTFIGAHMGGNRFYPQVLEYLCGRPNLYLDTAIMSRLDKNDLYISRIIESHGVDRILFGTDAPWSEPKNEVAFIKSLGLSKTDEEKIFHLNAEGLLFR